MFNSVFNTNYIRDYVVSNKFTTIVMNIKLFPLGNLQ